MKKKIYQKASYSSLLSDTKVIEEIQNKVGEGVLSIPENMVGTMGGLESMDTSTNLEALLESNLASHPQPGTFNSLEAIILVEGRPPLLVQNDTFETPNLDELKVRLEKSRANIESAIRNIGRLELIGHPSLDYAGTAWRISEDILITNRHVAQVFSRLYGNTIRIRSAPNGDLLKSKIDFKEEHGNDDTFELAIKEVVHLEHDMPNHPDMALVRIEKDDRLPKPIELSPIDPLHGDHIAVIGYPARDPFRNDVDIMENYFKGIYGVKRLSPGIVSGVDENTFIFNHDCTTLGGNSGSVALSLASGEAIGLHFAGSFLENNYAVKSTEILNRLTKLNSSVFIPDTTEPVETPRFITEAPTAEDLSDREGYDPDFLGIEVKLPELLNELKPELAELKNNAGNELKYKNFSIFMHKSRRMAIYTVTNIDGKKWRHIVRGRDKWFYDPRMDKKYQAGNELYKYNKLHRGHLTRRLDPSSGDSYDEAKQAVEDTFYWTNCTPQHQSFNPRTWLDLEKYVLDNSIENDLRVSVFTGPVFRETDKSYREFQIPEDYWKVLASMNKHTGKLSVTAYILSQSEFMEDLEFIYGGYRTYQVPLNKIIELTKIDFNHLKDHDRLSRLESIPYLEISGPEDIIF